MRTRSRRLPSPWPRGLPTLEDEEVEEEEALFCAARARVDAHGTYLLTRSEGQGGPRAYPYVVCCLAV